MEEGYEQALVWPSGLGGTFFFGESLRVKGTGTVAVHLYAIIEEAAKAVECTGEQTISRKGKRC